MYVGLQNDQLKVPKIIKIWHLEISKSNIFGLKA